MNVMMSSSLSVYQQNRRLQRKGNTGFRLTGLPIAKQSGEILEPVSPLVAKQFQVQMERESKRRQMTTGLLLILIAGLGAATVLFTMGLI